MATSAIPAAIDFLVTTSEGLFADPVVVSDGWYPGRAKQLLMIGVTDQDPTTSLQATWAGLGASKQDEDFTIPCVIWCTGGDADQKLVRDQAFVIYDALVTALLANKNLGGALNPPGIAQVSRGQLEQTQGAEQAGSGRAARIYFTVHCTSRLAA